MLHLNKHSMDYAYLLAKRELVEQPFLIVRGVDVIIPDLDLFFNHQSSSLGCVLPLKVDESTRILKQVIIILVFL